MSSSTIRAAILADLAEDIPATWRVEDGLWTVTDVAQPTLWVEYSALAPAAAAPGSAVDVTVDLCIITQYKDMGKAEDEADENVLVLYGALLRSQQVTGVTASKTVWEDQYLGWRVSATVTVPNAHFITPVDVPDTEPEEA